MKTIKLNTNGISISYYDFGKSDSVIVFIHGFPFDKSSWDLQLEAMQSDFRVIAYDIRGFGQSTSDSKPFSIDLFADDLIGLLDELGLDKVVLCGLSMGGYIALNAVTRYPERFHKLILCDTQCNDDNDEAKEKRYKTIDLLNNGGIKIWADAFTKNLFTESAFQNNMNAVINIKSVMLSTPISTLVSTLKALADRKETCSKLFSVNTPTLIICGDSDVVTPPEKSIQMNQNIKSSILRIVPKAAHLCNVERPETFNSFIREFLNENY